MTGLREARWTGTGEMQLTPAKAASQEARSGAERRRWFAAASAAVERRQASAPLPALPTRGGGKRDQARGRIRRCGRKVTRLSAFRLPDFCEPGAIEMGAGNTAGGR